MFAAAKWEADPNDISNSGYERIRAAKIARMTQQEVVAWNDLCEFIAHEISTVAFDCMMSGKTSPSEYSLAHLAAVRACKLPTNPTQKEDD